MKDSGVEWLGEIPVHWEVKTLKHVFANLDNRRIPLSGEERAAMAKEYPYYLFDEPLILVAEDGANLCSRSTPLAFVATGKYWVNNHAHILKPHDGMVSHWAHGFPLFAAAKTTAGIISAGRRLRKRKDSLPPDPVRRLPPPGRRSCPSPRRR